MTVNGKQKYRLSCGSKDGVPAFGPDIPDPAIFDKNELFRSFVLAKRKLHYCYRTITVSTNWSVR